VHEAVLRQVIRRCDITAQFAQKISNLRLVAPHQLAESGGILSGYDSCDELIIIIGPQHRPSGY